MSFRCFSSAYTPAPAFHSGCGDSLSFWNSEQVCFPHCTDTNNWALKPHLSVTASYVVVVCLSPAVQLLLCYFFLVLGIFLQGTSMTIWGQALTVCHQSCKEVSAHTDSIVGSEASFFASCQTRFCLWLHLHPPSATPPHLGQHLHKPAWPAPWFCAVTPGLSQFQ